MATTYLHRLHVIIPAARCAAVNAWCKANLNPEGGDWFTPSLSADGNEPYTHAECSVALTNSELKLLLAQLLSMASASLPANWDSRTRAQKKAWLLAARDAFDVQTGIYLTPSDNDGVWEEPEEARTHKGVQTASSISP